MASADTSYLSLLKEEVGCALCLEQLRTPRMLTCMHSFCERCLESYQKQQATRGTITCPLCKEKTVLRDEEISALRQDFRAISLVEKLEKATRKQQKKKEVPKICEVCGDTDSAGTSSYVNCLECEQVMCKKCGELHQKMKSSRHHTLSANPSSTRKPADKHQALDQAGVCVKHRGRKVDLFCTTCLSPVCQECSGTDHRKHQCLPVKVLAPTMREEISSRLSKATLQSAEGIEVIACVDNVERSLKNFDNRIEAAFKSCTDRWKCAQSRRNGKFLHSQMETLLELRHKVERHAENLKKVQLIANDLLMANKQYSLATSFKVLLNSLDHLLCETPDRSSIEAISKTVSQLEFKVNHETRFGSLAVASRQRKNIGVETQGGPTDLTFTRDGRLAVYAEFNGPSDSSKELSYYLKDYYGGKYYKKEQLVREPCSYSAIRQTSAAYWVAEKFVIERRVNLHSQSGTLISLSDLRFAALSGIPFIWSPQTCQKLLLLNEKLMETRLFNLTCHDITSDLEDNIYISADGSLIYVVRPNGTMIETIPTGYFQPNHIAICPCSPDQILFTHDSSKVSVIDRNGNLLQTITHPEWKEVAIGCDNKKLLYVLWKCERNLRTLQRFTMEGHLLDTLIESESHGCPSLLLTVSPEGSAAVVTDTGKGGNVTVISTTRNINSSDVY